MKSTFRFLRAILLTAVVYVANSSFVASAQNQDQSLIYSQLLSPSTTKRDAAYLEVLRQQDPTLRGLLQTLDSLRNNPVGNPHGFDEPLDLTLRALTLLQVRSKSISGRLLGMLDLQLDPATIPFVRNPSNAEFYPAARAFAAIADKEDIESLFQYMRGAQVNEKRLRIHAWILTEVEGQRLARLDVASRLDDETRALKKRQQDDSDYRQNLQKMKELVDSDEGSYLIRRPTKETPSQTQKPAPK